MEIDIVPVGGTENPWRRAHCQVSEFGKDVMAASIGQRIKITGHGKYEPGMLGFEIERASAEIVPTSAPEVSASKTKEEISPATPIDDEDKKADAEASAMRENLLRSAGLKDNVRKPEDKPAETASVGKTAATDPLEVARAKGHEIATKMVANQNAAKQLMSDVANASQQNDTSQIQSLQRQLAKIQQTKARLSAEGVEYMNTLNQAERDAFVEGFQAAQAGK